jgi:CRP-like cAMP-binding protein
MERLINFFHQINPVSEEGKQLMIDNLYMESVSKNENYFEEGKICNKIGFVVEVILRVVHTNEEGKETTRYFINEGHFGVDLDSFTNQVPAKERLEALTDCEFIVMTRDALNLFKNEIPNFASTVSFLIEKSLLEKYNIKSEMFTDDASTRYKKLMERNPSIMQRVPLGIISSFLGVTQYTLSRIRKEYR